MQLDKITQGLKQEAVKIEPTPMDENAINRYITARNEQIIVATPYAMMRFRRNKNKEEDETSAE
ncbi:hypothetical protein HRG49_13260 [Enterococcus faecalis]|jgi:hypothetical protein|uniref:hypothetical protein n=1 Tax=Bacillus TaxID=1386 RepID=UPI000DC2466A|nr:MULTISPECIES: hypothetical protein [Bacillus]NST54691.1 hypothetical protein [Enterococcus faecalis]RAN67606.1 hypothetical protein B5P40_24380 [Bacillus sp. SRB_8]WJE74224.1 hypothetical protein QRE62_03635 [Bacillus mycoides]